MIETIYTPDSQLKDPLNLFRSMLADLRASHHLAWRLLIRNISAQYRQTLLGYVWAFLPPIATTLTFVFLKSQKVMSFEETSIPYTVYVMIGTLLWQVFIDALNSPIKLVIQSRQMLTKVHFPREALILAGIGEVLFNFVIRLILFLITMLYFKVPLTATILLAPLGILALIMMGTMLGIILTPLAVLYQDIQRGLMILTSLWFFLTPIVYPTPTKWPASLLATVNPVSPLLVTTREWILMGTTINLIPFLIVSGVTFLFILLGWIVYRIAMPHLIARIGS